MAAYGMDIHHNYCYDRTRYNREMSWMSINDESTAQ
jgi:hypothetical protein